MRAEFLTPAAQEFLAAVDFYEARAPGLGGELIIDLEASIKLVSEFPNLGTPGPGSTRRIHLRRFPYSLVYRAEEDILRIVAVEHQRRGPGFWIGRS